jgi:hypothetical protein
MENRRFDGMHDMVARKQLTHEIFRAAHERRMARLESGDPDAISAAIADERDALYSHADAVRTHTEQLAKLTT